MPLIAQPIGFHENLSASVSMSDMARALRSNASASYQGVVQQQQGSDSHGDEGNVALSPLTANVPRCVEYVTAKSPGVTNVSTGVHSVTRGRMLSSHA